MRFTSIITAVTACAVAVSALPSVTSLAKRAFDTFSEKTIFTPPSTYTDPRVLYARTVLLDNGVLLATWENYSPEPPQVYFPIYRSTDGGETWTQISKVVDTQHGWGMRYQPFLYKLNHPVGAYPAGTILCAGNSIPTDLSQTSIDIYASTDGGYTWKFASTVVAGGAAKTQNGNTPVWEPFINWYKGSIVVYYSDQGDPAYAQKLAHKVSTDLKTWSAAVNDVAVAPYTARPGMTTVALLPNGQWMMTYEYGGGPGFSGYSFPVYYKISDSPLTFGSAVGQPIVAGSVHPQGSPYITWTSSGGANGTIVVSCGTRSEIFLNTRLGDVNSWTMLSTPQSTSYSRHLRLMNNSHHLMIMGGGVLPPSTTNKISLSVMLI